MKVKTDLFVFLSLSSHTNISDFSIVARPICLETHHLSFIKPEGQVCDKSEVLYNFQFLKNKIIWDEYNKATILGL